MIFRKLNIELLNELKYKVSKLNFDLKPNAVLGVYNEYEYNRTVEFRFNIVIDKYYYGVRDITIGNFFTVDLYVINADEFYNIINVTKEYRNIICNNNFLTNYINELKLSYNYDSGVCSQKIKVERYNISKTIDFIFEKAYIVSKNNNSIFKNVSDFY